MSVGFSLYYVHFFEEDELKMIMVFSSRLLVEMMIVWSWMMMMAMVSICPSTRKTFANACKLLKSYHENL